MINRASKGKRKDEVQTNLFSDQINWMMCTSLVDLSILHQSHQEGKGMLESINLLYVWLLDSIFLWYKTTGQGWKLIKIDHLISWKLKITG